MENNSDNSIEIMDYLRKDWKFIYKIAGITTIFSVALVLLDLYLSFTGSDVETGTLSTMEWFALLHEHWFIGLRNLGIFNVLNPILLLPLYLALVKIHWRSFPGISILILLLFILGGAVYIANNGALAFLTLTDQYYHATTMTQKEILETAGTMVLAQSEDFTMGTFPGLFIQNLAAVLLLIVVVKGQILSRWLSIIGLFGTLALMVFTISCTFLPRYFSIAMVMAVFGGMLMIFWNTTMAFKMLHWKEEGNHGDNRLG